MEKLVLPLPATPHIKMTNPGSGLSSDSAASSVRGSLMDFKTSKFAVVRYCMSCGSPASPEGQAG